MNRNFTVKHRGWRARAGIGLPVLFMALALQAPAWAKHKKVTGLPQQQVESPPRLMAEVSRDRIVEAAEKRHGAQVIKVEEGTHKGKRVYVLRLLSKKEGRVWTIKVDPETGGEI
jgi:hypothetical protein